jgi:drug/metabolite transporter (DMT)-like permease
MCAFAGNSLLCRIALRSGSIDAASFTAVRVAAGAAVLWLAARGRGGLLGSWRSGAALFAYAAAFSLAYLTLSASAGALLLFGAVQATMIGWGLRSGERLHGMQIAGVLLAFGGLVGLLLPGLTAPPLVGSLLMLAAGVAWGVYSLRGRGSGDPLRATAGNFARALPFAAALALVSRLHAEPRGLAYAALSGGITSGLGYALWYAALPGMKATTAAVVQLSVPVLTAFGAVWLLHEDVTVRLVAASAAILGGIALVVARRG